MKAKLIFIFVTIVLICTTYSQTANFTISITDSLRPISPYIYGTNQLLNGNENWGALRQGGNRMTGYNWENNASNAGSDYLQHSDNYLTSIAGIPKDSENVPGIVTTTFQNQANSLGAYSLVTLQMAGYVARDKNGTVPDSQTAPSSRWAQVQFQKGSPLSLVPDTSDNYVYMDEYVNFLINKFGQANSATGIDAYSLDNEPSLWPSTHPRIHPDATTCKEITQKVIDLSKVVKNLDPSAEIFGPALYGFNAYLSFQNAQDWYAVSRGKNYSWFIDYYLDRLKQASDSTGKRLLDVLDLHWYPEAQGADSKRITDNTANTTVDKYARMQAPRTLWDKNYIENSWIAKSYGSYLPLIPHLMNSINKYYPGTKLGFTEFTYGGENDISGAIAVDDVLGIFAKYGVYFGTFWQIQSPSTYVSAAYKMYRNYDGNNSTFGNYYLPSNTNDSLDCSIYASYNIGEDLIHLIVINKNLSYTITGNFTLQSTNQIQNGTVWELTAGSSTIKKGPDVTGIVNNSFSYDLPPTSVCHFILKTSNIVGIKDNNTVPVTYYLKSYPNPFNPSCKIEYSAPSSSISQITIISITGQVIKTFDNLTNSGTVKWYGKNNANREVSSGVYIAILKSGNRTLSRQKLMLLK